MALGIIEKDLKGVSVLELAGQIVVGEESNRLRSKTKEILDSGKTEVVMDLTQVSYIDSTGLGTILAVYTTARSLGANIKLAGLRRQFRDQLHVTGLERVFEIYDQVEDAVKSFRSAP